MQTNISRVRRGWVAAVFLIASVTLSLGNVIASFKHVMRFDLVIPLARCVPAQDGTVMCTPVETWRGVPPKSPIVISQSGWASDPVNDLEKDTQSLFLMAIDARGRAACLSTEVILGADLPTGERER